MLDIPGAAKRLMSGIGKTCQLWPSHLAKTLPVLSFDAELGFLCSGKHENQ